MNKVTIYTTPTCTFCRAAKEFFHEHNVDYTEYNVASDAQKREEMIEKSGQMGVPVILVHSLDGDGEEVGEPEMVVGFYKPKLAELLGVAV